jgi:hypothetical protein
MQGLQGIQRYIHFKNYNSGKDPFSKYFSHENISK